MKKIIITESQYKRLFNENVLSDMGGDFARDLLSAVPIIGDLGVALPSIIRNAKQIKGETKKLKDVMASDGSKKTIEKLQKNISRDIVDLLQSILGASPDPGISELISSISSILDNISKVLGKDVLLILLYKEKKILSFIEKFLKLDITSKLIPKDLDIRFIVLDALKTLKESIDYLESKSDVDDYKDLENLILKNVGKV